MDLGKMIGYLINVALVLATLGLLRQATVVFKNEAMLTAQHGTVPLHSFNRRPIQGRTNWKQVHSAPLGKHGLLNE